MTEKHLFEQAAANMLAACNPQYLQAVAEAIGTIAGALGGGKKLLVFGNGGSAADAQHICAELVGRFQLERRGLPAIALTSNQSVLTSCGNDHGFDSIFERQIEAFGAAGDVAWGISTSGNSPNVVRACQYAREHGLKTIGLTGTSGGRMTPWCDIVLAAPASETPRIQEVHLVTYHAICSGVEARLFGG